MLLPITVFYQFSVWGGGSPLHGRAVECGNCLAYRVVLTSQPITGLTLSANRPRALSSLDGSTPPPAIPRKGGRVSRPTHWIGYAYRIAWHCIYACIKERRGATLSRAREKKSYMIRRSRNPFGSAYAAAVNRVFQNLFNLKTYARNSAAASFSPHKNPNLPTQPLFW